jgi:Ca2+:H+ antiporter
MATAVDRTSSGIGEATLQPLSVAVALVLIAVYGLTLLFSLKTHAYLYEVSTTEHASASEAAARPALLPWGSALLVVAIAIGIESELLVGSLEAATAQLGLTPLFVGVIVLPVIGNAAEHAAAVTVALKDKMDLALSVAVGSSLQIALFVAPVLVIAGWWLGQPMDLDFNPFELVAVAVAVLVANSIASDGRSNWFEGSLLLATYAVIGLAFFFHPPD